MSTDSGFLDSIDLCPNQTEKSTNLRKRSDECLQLCLDVTNLCLLMTLKTVFLSRDCFITNSVGAFILVLVTLW